MKKRRKRPAPPLVLQPSFARFPKDGQKASGLLRLACFLEKRSLLTDGGAKNLAQGLRGRNGVVSLGLQDVRSYAHGLVGELLRANEKLWQTLAEEYFQTYDKGKPRRPTHLQRLYLDWSDDLSWPGLLRACRHHPSLWPELELAIDRLEDESEDRTLLSLALLCRTSVGPWEESFESGERATLLRLLPLLPADDFRHRLPWLASRAAGPEAARDWGFELVRACHLNFANARSLRDLDFDRSSLEQLALQHLPESDDFDPVFVSAFRSFVTTPHTVERLLSAIPEDDRLRFAVFGPRPGRLWLEVQKNEMLQLIELR